MKLFTPTHVTMHNSLTKDSKTVSWQPIRRYHVMELGFDEVGYQYGVELVNAVYEVLVGRFEGQQGAHCPQQNMNRISIGICMIGNFEEDYPDMAQWNVGADLVANIITRYNIPVENVKGHSDYAPWKHCPGKNFDMNKFRTEVSNLIQ